MPDETKEQGTGTLPASESELPEAFTKAIDAIDAEKGKTQEVASEIPRKDEAAESASQIPAEEGEETETLPAETAGETPPEGDLSAKDTEIINGLDPEVLETLTNYGWSNEKIAKELKDSPELADDIRDALDEEAKKDRIPVTEIPSKAQERETVIEELKLNLDPDVVGADLKTELDKIVDALNVSRKEAQQIRTELLAEKEEIQRQKNAIYNERIDKCFDRYAKQIPTLGKSFNLSKYNTKVRKEIYGYASMTSQIKGLPIERAIEQEIRLYPYRYMKPHEVKDQAKQEIIDELNKQEKRFTNPPARSPSRMVQRQFGSEAEEKDYTIRRVDEKYAG